MDWKPRKDLAMVSSEQMGKGLDKDKILRLITYLRCGQDWQEDEWAWASVSSFLISKSYMRI